VKIRDLHATVNGNDKEIIFDSGGIEIVADDGNTLFSLRLEDNELLISSGNICKHNDAVLEDRFVIKPRAANCVDLVRVEYTSLGT